MAVSVESLKTCGLFKDFTDTGLGILAGIGRFRDVAQGLSIFLQGSPGESLFMVERGTIEISEGSVESRTLLAVLDKGEHFGELALLRPGRRVVSARARTSCRLIEIRRADFNELLREKPQACIKLILAIFVTVERRLDAIRGELLDLAR